MTPICICGKSIDEGELYCCDRCEYVAMHLNAFINRQAVELVRAKQFFYDEWDKGARDDNHTS